MSFSTYTQKMSGAPMVPANDELVLLPVAHETVVESVRALLGARRLRCPVPAPDKHEEPGSPS